VNGALNRGILAPNRGILACNADRSALGVISITQTRHLENRCAQS
jgi:hypothetical protein